MQKQHGMVYTCQHGPFRPFFHASVAPVGTKAGSSAHPRATSRPRWHPQRWADPFQHPCHPRRRPCPRARRPNPPNPNPRGPVAREQAVAPSHRAVAEPLPSPPSRRCRAAIEPSCEAPACARTRARTHAHKDEESTSRAGGRRSGRHGAGRHGTDGRGKTGSGGGGGGGGGQGQHAPANKGKQHVRAPCTRAPHRTTPHLTAPPSCRRVVVASPPPPRSAARELEGDRRSGRGSCPTPRVFRHRAHRPAPRRSNKSRR